VTCEALATGLPVVLYEGLVSRELKFLGASEFLQTVPMGEIDLFKKKLEFFIANPVNSQQKKKIQEFANQQLNLEKTGVRFAQDIENLVFNIYD
jgi:glycosyltransferase involved in cell wall biosynthesis